MQTMLWLLVQKSLLWDDIHPRALPGSSRKLLQLDTTDCSGSIREPLRYDCGSFYIMTYVGAIRQTKGLTFWFEAVLKLIKDPELVDCCMLWEADAIIQTMHRATHSLLHVVRLPPPMLKCPCSGRARVPCVQAALCSA